MFDPSLAQDSIKKDEDQLEPNTTGSAPTEKREPLNDTEDTKQEALNINVASTTQFEQEESKGTPRGQNKDLSQVSDQRPFTAPVAGAMDDDWPATDKDEQIARLSVQMRAATNENLLAKVYK